jgi:hypothetical protein
MYLSNFLEKKTILVSNSIILRVVLTGVSGTLVKDTKKQKI